jgi:hypothetical protein
MKSSLLFFYCFGFFCRTISSDEVYSDLKSQFEDLKKDNEIYSSKTIALAVKVKHFMENNETSDEALNLLNELKTDLPPSVRVVVWGEKTKLCNKHFSEQCLYAHNGNITLENFPREVYLSSKGDEKFSGLWKFTPLNYGGTFLLENLQWNQYLYTAGDVFGRVFLWQSNFCEGCEWIVEIIDDEEICLKYTAFHGYYYAATDLFIGGFSGKKTYTWLPQTSCDNSCVWRLVPQVEGE